MNARQQQALQLVRAGLSIIPVRPDGSKAATIKWHQYQETAPTEMEVCRWFGSLHSGIAILGGSASGGLEILDFDDAEVFDPWRNLVTQIYEGVLDGLPMVRTPSHGVHVYYRVQGHIEGNRKLARRRDPQGSIETRIETRGQGGYVLSPYCHPDCHERHQPYMLMQGDLTKIPLISQRAHEVLINSAKVFEEIVDPPKRTVYTSRIPHENERPGDVFAKTHSWGEILMPAGWQRVGHQGDTEYWKRPDKRERGWSASTNHDGHDLLYVFSTNCHPFEANRGYSKFTTYTLLRFQGDFSAAAKAVMKG